jgi:Zn-dependent protease with chaperone function/predicted negative regulator of RcsB-dependent stress response
MIRGKVMTTRRILALTLVSLLALTTVQPALAQGSIANPKLFDESVKAAAEAVKQYGTPDDPERLARVDRIGYELAQQADFQKFPFIFGIVNMPEPNAFALPAGQIFITTGMLDLGLDDDMLANVLGHEIGHVVHEHYLHMQRRQTLMSVLGNLLVAGVILGESRSNNRSTAQAPYDPRVGYQQDNGGNLVQGAAAASLVVSELLLRSYSRDNEDEADKEGQLLAAAAGYSPDGARRLWDLMNSRAPQLKEYGYWQTHPFADVRERAAEARKGTWAVQAKKSADDYRKRTQATLSTYLRQSNKKPDEGVTAYVKQAVLAAWPQGRESDALRLEKLHKRRDDELARPVLSRDYGAVLRLYRKELGQVKGIDPKSDLIAALDGEISDLEAKRKDLYPRAVKVLDGGIYETSFLESFLSNFPEATQVPEVALALGDAYSRLGNRTEAVTQYLKAWDSAPQSSEGKRAATGLRNLAPNLQELAALQQMASQTKDSELKRLADERLAAIAKSYDELKNGAEYLRRYPEGPYVVPVIERLNVLADNLYGEVVLYRSVGDTVKAMERINKILTDAPLSPAAAKLRDQAVLEAKAG